VAKPTRQRPVAASTWEGTSAYEGRDRFQYRAGVQVLDLRDVVDPSGHHARDRGPLAHDPDPVHMVETLNRISRVNRNMVNEMGREPR